jgi:hypothetical protein
MNLKIYLETNNKYKYSFLFTFIFIALFFLYILIFRVDDPSGNWNKTFSLKSFKDLRYLLFSYSAIFIFYLFYEKKLIYNHKKNLTSHHYFIFLILLSFYMYFYVYASNINYLFAPPSGNYPWPQYLRNPEILYKAEDWPDIVRTKLVGLTYLFNFFNFILDKFLINHLYRVYFLIFLITNFFTIILLKRFFDKVFSTDNNLIKIFLVIYPFLLYPFSVELFALFFVSIILNLIISLKTRSNFKLFTISFLSIFVFLISNSQIFLLFFIAFVYFIYKEQNFKNLIIFSTFAVISFILIYFLTLFLFNLDILKLTFWRINKIHQIQQYIPTNKILQSVLSSLFNKAINLGPIFILFVLNLKYLIKNKSYLTFFTFFLLIVADAIMIAPESTRQMQNLSIIFSFVVLYEINKKMGSNFINLKKNFHIFSIFTLFYLLAFHFSLPIIEFQFTIINMTSINKIMMMINPPLFESNYFFDTYISRKFLWKIILITSFVLLFKTYLIKTKLIYNK